MDRVEIEDPASRTESAITALRLLERQVSIALADTGLTPDAWRTLRRIVHAPGCSMKDLLDALALPPATATRVVDSLVERSAAYRRIADDDRRSVVVYPTGAGIETLALADSAVAQATH